MILFTIEQLFHFQCQKCKSYWTIGDYQKSLTMSCPSCGCVQVVEEMSKEQQEANMKTDAEKFREELTYFISDKDTLTTMYIPRDDKTQKDEYDPLSLFLIDGQRLHKDDDHKIGKWNFRELALNMCEGASIENRQKMIDSLLSLVDEIKQLESDEI